MEPKRSELWRMARGARPHLLSAASAALMSLLASAAAGADPADTRVFSSLCTAPEGTDISGVRIKLMGTPPTVSFEETEGALMVMTETRDVRFSAATGALSFAVDTEAGRVTFHGHVSLSDLVGTLTRDGNPPEEIRVPSDKIGSGDGEGPCAPTTESPRP